MDFILIKHEIKLIDNCIRIRYWNLENERKQKSKNQQSEGKRAALEKKHDIREKEFRIK